MVDIGAALWQWASEQSGAVRAELALRQYVRVESDVRFRGRLSVGYDRPDRIASVYVTPTQDPDVSARPIGPVHVSSDDVWSDVVGEVSSWFGPSPTERARGRIGPRAARRIASRLESRMTVAVDLCVGRPRFALDRLEVGQMPRTDVEPSDTTWIDTQRVRLRRGGLGAAGPYDPADRALQVEVRVTEGSGVHAALACEADAERALDAWLAGDRGAAESVASIARATVHGGGAERLEADGACPAVLLTWPREGDTAFELVAQGADGSPRRFVDGCEEDHGGSAGRARTTSSAGSP